MRIVETYIVRVDGIADYKRLGGSSVFQRNPIYKKIDRTENNRYFIENGRDLDEISEEDFLNFKNNTK